MERQENICRLCLQECGKHVKAMQGNVKEILDILLLKIDVAVSEEPVICANCEEVLRKCFEFKITCLQQHQFTVPFIKNESGNVDLDQNEARLNKKEYVDVTSTSEEYNICKLCLGPLKSSYMSLDNEEGHVFLALKKYFSELDLHTTQKRVICVSCYKYLQNYFNFGTKCMAVEEDIRKYCKTARIGTRKIKLRNVLKFTPNNICEGSIVKEDNVIHDKSQRLIGSEAKKCNDETPSSSNNLLLCKEGDYTSYSIKKELESEEEECETEQKLNNVPHFTSEDLLACEKTNFAFDMIKMEQPYCEKKKNKLELENEMQEFLTFDKGEIEIKTEADIERFQGSISSPQSEANSSQSKKLKNLELRSHESDEASLVKSGKKYKLDLGGHSETQKNISIEMYHCDLCSLKTGSKIIFDKHLLSHGKHSKIHKCQHCAYLTKYKATLNRHLLTHKEDSEITMHYCDYCSFRSKYRANVNRHLLIHKTSSDVPTYKCNICKYETECKEYLERHNLTHKTSSKASVYRCNSCSYHSECKKRFRAHLSTHRNSSKIKIYHCEFCSFQAKRKHVIARHTLTHKSPSEVVAYKCPSCSYQTKYKSSILQHMLTHKNPTEITMFRCNHCSYQTKFKTNLKRHSLKHKNPSEIPIYKCDSCTYQTKYKDSLKMHGITHTEPSDMLAYRCEFCSYKTKCKRYLRNHLLVHKKMSAVTMYKCEYCSYKSKFKKVLQTHLLTHESSPDITMYNLGTKYKKILPKPM